MVKIDVTAWVGLMQIVQTVSKPDRLVGVRGYDRVEKSPKNPLQGRLK